MDIDDNIDSASMSSHDDVDVDDSESRDRDLADGDSLFKYNADDVNAFFEKVLFGVGNTDPHLTRLGEGLMRACAENNLLQVIQGTLHLVVLYQGEKMGLRPMAKGKDEGTLTMSKKERRQKQKKRRRNHSTISENDSSKKNDLQNAGVGDAQSTRSDLNGPEIVPGSDAGSNSALPVPNIEVPEYLAIVPDADASDLTSTNIEYQIVWLGSTPATVFWTPTAVDSAPAENSSRKGNKTTKFECQRDNDTQSTRSSESESDEVQKNVKRRRRRKKRRFDESMNSGDIDSDIEENESPKRNETQLNPEHDSEGLFPTTKQRGGVEVFELEEEEEIDISMLPEDIVIDPDYEPDSAQDSSEDSDSAPNIEDLEILEELPPPDVDTENEDSSSTKQSSAEIQRNKTRSDSAVLFPKTKQGQPEQVFKLEEEESSSSRLPEDIEIDPDYEPDSAEDSNEDSDSASPNIEDLETMEELPPSELENDNSRAKESSAEIQRNKPTCHTETLDLTSSHSPGLAPKTEPQQEEDAFESEEEELPPPDLENDATSANQSSEEIERNKPKYTCHFCKKTFTDKSKWTSHLRVHTDERPFPCPHPGCGTAFKWKSHLTRHLLLHKGKRPFKCNFPGCSMAFTTSHNLKRHQEVHTRPFMCDFQGCFRIFKGARSLKTHKKMHLSPIFQCDFPNCAQVFTRADHLKSHQHTHAGPFQSDFQGSSSSRTCAAESLTNQRPQFQCGFPGCSKVYRQPDSLYRHEKTHERPLPSFQCDFEGCSKTFTNSGHLKNHRKTHARTTRKLKGDFTATPKSREPILAKPLKCSFPGCSKTFSQGYCLKQHELTHTKKKPFKCHCGKGFNDPSNMNRHRKTCPKEK